MKELLLSVVVPVYNAADSLMSLADAFARQATESFEVIFVDDGSTDESDAVLRQIGASGSFCARIVRCAHAGVSAARNAGMAHASGRYLAFVDADDMIAPDYVKGLLACVQGGAELYVFRHSRVVKGAAAFDNLSGTETEITADALLDRLLSNPTRFGVYDFLIRRSFAQNAGLRFPAGYPYYEDYDFTLRLFDATTHARVVERCLYCYRAVPGSAMTIFSDERLRCLELFDDNRSQYLEHRCVFSVRYRKWFVARLSWSILWQASVAMDVRAACAFARKTGIHLRMRSLTDYPDRRVSWSARAYVHCAGFAITLMKALGKGRTLIPSGK